MGCEFRVGVREEVSQKAVEMLELAWWRLELRWWPVEGKIK